MKNLIKVLIVVISLTLTGESFAQKFGVKAGLNLSNQITKDDSRTYNEGIKMKTGFHIGGTIEFPITEIFSFETGLFLTTKGYKVDTETAEEVGTGTATGKLNLYYLQVPLTGKATLNVGKVKIYGVFGPYLGIGLTGKGKFEHTYMGETETTKTDVQWGTDAETDHYKRIDFGLSSGAGVKIQSINIGLSYDLGVANISPSTDGGLKITNYVFGLSVGYSFGGK